MSITLPINERREEIIFAIARHQVIVLCGETGSGKTTQLPQICRGMGLGDKRMIAHTQPRRLAARAVAARIAEEMGVRLGGAVGVKVRFQDQTSRDTKIKLLTDGMLLAELGTDPELRAYDTIIIDEAHERSLNIDFLLGVLRGLLPKRPDLKLIITSATIDPQKFSNFFGGQVIAPVIEVSGRTYPVEVRYHPTRDDEDEFERIEVEAVADAVDELLSPRLPKGDVLVFLPGEREIRLAADAVRRSVGTSAEVLPLFARLSNAEQDRIFHPDPARRRVILSTNVAETSLTVPGIRYVVDTGFARINRYDPARKIQRLPIEPVSRASAMQRSGRCGRVAEGVCIRLYSEDSFARRPVFTDPEVRRVNLASVILQMRALGLGAIEEFPFLDKPDAAAVKDGYETLFELGAIDSPSREGKITEIGRAIARLPVDPRIGRMLIAAEGEGSLKEAIILAAALSIQDPRERPAGRQEDADRSQLVFRNEKSDFLTLLNLWEQYEHAESTLGRGEVFAWCRDRFVSAARMREWGEMIRQLREIAQDLELRFNDGRASDDAVHRALLTGLISNVACREGDGGFEYRGVRGNVVSIFPGSALFKKAPKWIMAAEVVQTTRLYARTVAKIEPEWIEELAGHVFQRQVSDKHLDAETGEPSAWERVSMSGVVVVPRRRVSLKQHDPRGARNIFIREALVQGKWAGDVGFVRRLREVMSEARTLEAKLRRRDVLTNEDALVEWFMTRLPESVCDPDSLLAWIASAKSEDLARLAIRIEEVLSPTARAAFNAAAFPDELVVGEHAWPLIYALAPGKDEDGVTVTVPLLDLPRLTSDRAAWGVPGILPELIGSLMKSLPKTQRNALEAKGAIASLTEQCAGVMTFGAGSVGAALSEATDVLFGVSIGPDLWSFKGLPAHLVLRVRVLDHNNKELAIGRDVGELMKRLEGRIRKAQAASARGKFAREGITTWDFRELPESVEVEGEDAAGVRKMYPALIDRGDSVTLTLVDASGSESRPTQEAGIRRLFVLAVKEELEHHLKALAAWDEMARQYQQLGSERDLIDALSCVVCERVFMFGQSEVTSKDEFEERLQGQWGKLSSGTREVGECVARVLAARAIVAKRFSGGTPRLWASSVADMREHAAYLMPRGFLTSVGWERLRQYPRYVEGLRTRLLNLREDGSGVEKDALAALAPWWKKWTGWVAAGMRGGGDEEEPKPAQASKTKAPLPGAKRAAPTVNVDAGEWAMEPGKLRAEMVAYRWALEEFRVALFTPEFAMKPAVGAKELEQLWSKVESAERTRAK